MEKNSMKFDQSSMKFDQSSMKFDQSSMKIDKFSKEIDEFSINNSKIFNEKIDENFLLFVSCLPLNEIAFNETVFPHYRDVQVLFENNMFNQFFEQLFFYYKHLKFVLFLTHGKLDRLRALGKCFAQISVLSISL